MIAKSFHKAFTEHPTSVNETYLQHMGVASSFGWRMLFSGVACLIHGILPFMFVKTGSNMIAELHGEMVVNRTRRDAHGSLLEGAD